VPVEDVQIKRIPKVRVAELSATAESFQPESIGPVIQPLYDQLAGRLREAGLAPSGPGIAYYEDCTDGDGAVVVHASVPVTAEPRDGHGFAIVDLPGIEQAATIVHRGPMDNVMSSIQTLARWIDRFGHRSAGHNRELYLDYGCGADPADWVTELQEPLVIGEGPA
ncbi:MAG: GyrI-like domain-containing protein, partial [Mycobacteriales bacterium]